MARGRQRLGIVVATAVAVGTVLLASASAGVGAGGLAQLASPNDCISEADASLGCGTTDGTGLNGADWIAASPDGKNVYVASFSGAGSVAEFARASDGSLSELGCVAAYGTECGTTALGLSEATSVAVSPDGQNVYVTGDQDDTVMIFDRDATDGTLTPAGCVQDAAARFDRGCGTTVHGMGNAYQVVVSPDGKNVYVAAGSGGAGDGAVVELARASDGSLSQLASPNDCIEEQSSSTPVCGTTGTGLLAVTALALNPNDGGTSLYAVADTHAVQAGDAPGALATFTRDTTTGALTQTGCIGESTSVAGITECQSTRAAGLSDLVNVAVSPDGSTVYTASDDPTGPIAEFARASDGSLTGLGCIDSGGTICGTKADGLASAFGIAVSPDGSNVYVASAGASSYGGATPVAPGLVELARASDGTLTGSGCIQQEGAANLTCQVTTGHGLGDALGVTVSPDGDNVYVATSSSGGAIATFSRGGGSPPPPSNQPPTAAFTSSASGRTVSFDATGSSDADGTVASYAWDFGDSTTGTGETPSHSYASAGTYTVTLTVTDNDGATASATHDVTATSPTPANQPPTAAFTASVSGLTVSVDGSNSSDADGTISSYTWDFGDGASGTGVTASHTYGAAGTYTVTLTVTDDDGATDVATQGVSVSVPSVPNLPPQSNFTAVPAPSVGSLAVALDASSSIDPDGTVVSYSWDYGDGTSGTGMTGRHTYTAAGTYAIALTVADDRGTTETTVHHITVPIRTSNQPPSATFTSSVDGLAVSVDGSGSSDPDGSITAYAWDFGDGTAATGATAAHTYSTGGVFVVALTVTDSDGAVTTTSRSVTLATPAPPPSSGNGSAAPAPSGGGGGDAAPTAAFAAATNGLEARFDASASSDNGTIASYTWDFGDGATGSGAAPTHTYAAAGTYTVTLTVSDNVELTGRVSHAVTVTATAAGWTTALTLDKQLYDEPLFDQTGYVYGHLITVFLQAHVAPVPDGGTITFQTAAGTFCGPVPVNTSTGDAHCGQQHVFPGDPIEVTASYSGDAAYQASTATIHVPLAKLTSTTLASAPQYATVGQPVRYTATVAPVPDGGTVAFTDGGTPVAGCAGVPVDASGSASCTTTPDSLGTHAVAAHYAGDDHFAASSASLSVGVATTTATTTTGVGIDGERAPFQAVQFTAQVSPAPSGGSVAFLLDGTALHGCDAVAVGPGGVASCPYTLSFGTGMSHTLSADYSGTPGFTQSSGSTTFTLDGYTQGTGVGMDFSTATPAVGQLVTFKASMAAIDQIAWLNIGNGKAVGKVTFYDGGVPIAGCERLAATWTIDKTYTWKVENANDANWPAIVLGSSAACTVAWKDAGDHTISMSYTGGFAGLMYIPGTYQPTHDEYYASGVSADLPVSVLAQAPPTTGGTPGPTPPRGIPGVFLGVPGFATVGAGTATTVRVTDGGSRASLTVPSGALPAGTMVNVYPVEQEKAARTLIPSTQAYVVSFAVSWKAPDGTSPRAKKPVRLTIVDKAIKAGDTIYEPFKGGARAVGRATVDGRATVTFTQDPLLIVAADPVVRVAAPRATRTAKGLAVSLACTRGECGGVATLSGVAGDRRIVVARSRYYAGGGTTTVTLRLTPGGRASLRTVHGTSLSVTVHGGKTATRRIRVTH